MTKIDTSTGMPELPEGYFWRIRRLSNRIIQVEIRRSGKLWSSVVDWDRIYLSSLGEETTRMARKFARHNKENEAISKLVGDYPPKSLNA